jgi:hypothetical protein
MTLAVLGASAAPRDASAEPEGRMHVLGRAWMATTISMPAASALLEPRVVQAPPHREAELAAPPTLVQAAAAMAAPRAYPEAVILRALRHGDSAFGRCWRRAQRQDSVAPPRKARLHLEVDSGGVVRAARWPATRCRDVWPRWGGGCRSRRWASRCR